MTTLEERSAHMGHERRARRRRLEHSKEAEEIADKLHVLLTRWMRAPTLQEELPIKRQFDKTLREYKTELKRTQLNAAKAEHHTRKQKVLKGVQ